MLPKISRITFIPVCIPAEKLVIHDEAFAYEPLNRGPSGGFDGPWFATVPNFVVKIEADTCVGWGMMTRQATTEEIEQASSALVGKSLDDINATTWINEERTQRGLHMAILCCKAVAMEKPLHAMFGPQQREAVPLARWAGMRTPQGAAKLARQARDEGRHSLKLKGNETIDVPGIAQAVAEATGEKVELLIDPNGRWGFEDTIERAKQIGSTPMPVMFEDPSQGSNFSKLMNAVAKVSDVKAVRTILFSKQVDELADEVDCLAGLNVQGTLPIIRESAARCAARNVPFWVGSSMESGISDVSILHMVSTFEAATFPSEIAGYDTRNVTLLAEPLDIRNGDLHFSDAPGLGVPVDEDAIEQCRVGDPVVFGS